MLTIEMLKQNPVLAALPEDTLQAIATMSRNDENIVIGTKVGTIHGQYDSDILSVTGISKNNEEKSYDYLKRVLTSYKLSVDEVKTTKQELDKAKSKITELNAKIADGTADEAIKQQLKDAKTQVTQLQSQLAAKEQELTKANADHDKALKATKVDFAFSQATAGLKFKDAVPESIRNILLTSAKAEILAKGAPDFVDDGKGGQVLVFRGADGNILNNVKNNLNPYSIQELLAESSLKDVLDNGRRVEGGGTGNDQHTFTGGSGEIDLSSAKTQMQADEAIERYLLSKGLTRDSAEFSDKSLQLRNENKVSELPLR